MGTPSTAVVVSYGCGLNWFFWAKMVKLMEYHRNKKMKTSRNLKKKKVTVFPGGHD